MGELCLAATAKSQPDAVIPSQVIETLFLLEYFDLKVQSSVRALIYSSSTAKTTEPDDFN